MRHASSAIHEVAHHSRQMYLQKVISSGEPGTNEIALRLAQAAGFDTGGTCAAHNEPAAGLNVQLEVYPSGMADAYAAQSKANVDNADGTLAIWIDRSVGVQRTAAYARSRNWPFPNMIPRIAQANAELPSCYKPLFVVCAYNSTVVDAILAFLTGHHICTLNVAGSRETPNAHDADAIRTLLSELFSACAALKK